MFLNLRIMFIFLVTVLAFNATYGSSCPQDINNFLEVYICEGHSLFATKRTDEDQKVTYEYRGFYPPGRIAYEVREGLYTLEMLSKCQSVCEPLTLLQMNELEEFVREIKHKLLGFEGSKEKERLIGKLGRDTYYDVTQFNCVDFAESLLKKYSGKTIVEAFREKNKTLSIFSDPMEPCFADRRIPGNCLNWGTDKAAFWAHYRQGLPSLLWQMFVVEKPWKTFRVVSTNLAALISVNLLSPYSDFLSPYPGLISTLWSGVVLGYSCYDLMISHSVPEAITLGHALFSTGTLSFLPFYYGGSTLRGVFGVFYSSVCQ